MFEWAQQTTQYPEVCYEGGVGQDVQGFVIKSCMALQIHFEAAIEDNGNQTELFVLILSMSFVNILLS